MTNPENYDSTVSVINLTTFEETKRIVVGKNPASIGIDATGDVIVGCWGDNDFMTIPLCYSLHRINAATHAVDKTFSNIFPANFVMKNSLAYVYSVSYMTGEKEFIEFNTATDAVTNSNFIANPNLINVPYGIAINNENEDIYISDAVDYSNAGRVFVFDKSGVKRFDFETGICPKRIVVLK
jgi:DNA-binding beta-propeller fold protein YncE